jgi:predicted transcriptional regulator YdeE
MATHQVEVVNRAYQFVGMSITAPWPDSFQEPSMKIQREFWERKGEVSLAKSRDILFSPGMYNGIIATYFACLEVAELSHVPEGMIGFTLPAVDYAKVDCTNKTEGEGYDKLFAWMKENGYEHRLYGACQIEAYYMDDEADEAPVEILIPISKAS